MDESTYIVKAAECKQISGHLGVELYKRMECSRGKAEKIGAWNMEEREAIKEFQQNIDMPFGSNISREASKLAIQALEKQIAKKAKVKKYSFYPHSTLIKSRYGKCPNCGTVQVDDRYCANCGQKLDWSDEIETD